MSVNKAVHTLNVDLSHLSKAEKNEKKASTAVTKAGASEKSALANIQAQEKAIVDQFTASPPTDAAPQTQELNQLFGLGEKYVQTQDKFGKQIASDKKTAAKDKKAVTSDRKQGLKDLKPAEYHLNLKQTNADRKELGLKSVKKVIRPPASAGLTKAVKIAEQAVSLERSQHCYDYTQTYGARTNYGLSPTTKQKDGRITFDCSGFVGAVYKAAGLKAPYTVGYTGTSYDVANNPNMQKVSESQAKPGDVVVFPDHIALYIGGGKCISMGGEGEPAVVTVAAEAAYKNRGIQGFYHLRGA